MTIQEYIEGMDGWQAEAVQSLVDLVNEAVPDAKGSIKWSQPVFDSGGPFCFIKPSKKYINFGFWWGIKLDDPDGLLQGAGEKMRHIKVAGPDDIKPEAFIRYVRQSAEMNRTLGDPTRTKA